MHANGFKTTIRRLKVSTLFKNFESTVTNRRIAVHNSNVINDHKRNLNSGTADVVRLVPTGMKI